MTVFLTGSTGYIGQSVAREFARNEYEVHGLTRTHAMNSKLQELGIHPVIGTMNDPDSYRDLAAHADLIVHTAYSPSDDSADLDRQTVETMLNLSQRNGGRPLVLYTSGTWVYGNTGSAVLESPPHRNALAAVSSRPAVEDLVLESGGIVIRPGVVYGHGGGITGSWIREAQKNDGIPIIGDGQNYWSMVHIDDLARGYRLAAERGKRGEAYDFVDDENLRMMDIAEIIITNVGKGSVSRLDLNEAEERWGVMAEAFAVNQRIGSESARSGLGWRAEIGSFRADPYLSSNAISTLVALG